MFRNLGIEISDDHIIHQYRQIQRPEESSDESEESDESDENDKGSRKYKLTIERRLDKRHFDAVF